MKNLKQFLALFLLIIGTTLSVQATDVLGNQDPKKEKRTPAATFEQIIVEGNFNVNIAPGSSADIEVEAESNLLEFIVTEAKGKTLNIKVAKKTKLVPTMPMTINITVPIISKVQYEGEGNLSISDVPASKLEMIVNGVCNCTLNKMATSALKATFANSCTVIGTEINGGDTKIAINDKSTCTLNQFTSTKFNLTAATVNAIKIDRLAAESVSCSANNTGAIDFAAMAASKDFEANVTGTSAVSATGTAPSITITTNSSSDFDASGVSNEKSKVTNTGSATVKVAPAASLDVILGGTGNLEYKGRPKIKIENNGSGQLINKNL